MRMPADFGIGFYTCWLRWPWRTASKKCQWRRQSCQTICRSSAAKNKAVLAKTNAGKSRYQRQRSRRIRRERARHWKKRRKRGSRQHAQAEAVYETQPRSRRPEGNKSQRPFTLNPASSIRRHKRCCEKEYIGQPIPAYSAAMPKEVAQQHHLPFLIVKEDTVYAAAHANAELEWLSYDDLQQSDKAVRKMNQ